MYINRTPETAFNKGPQTTVHKADEWWCPSQHSVQPVCQNWRAGPAPITALHQRRRRRHWEVGCSEFNMKFAGIDTATGWPQACTPASRLVPLRILQPQLQDRPPIAPRLADADELQELILPRLQQACSIHETTALAHAAMLQVCHSLLKHRQQHAKHVNVQRLTALCGSTLIARREQHCITVAGLHAVYLPAGRGCAAAAHLGPGPCPRTWSPASTSGAAVSQPTRGDGWHGVVACWHLLSSAPHTAATVRLCSGAERRARRAKPSRYSRCSSSTTAAAPGMSHGTATPAGAAPAVAAVDACTQHRVGSRLPSLSRESSICSSARRARVACSH